MQITNETILKLAQLSKIELTDEEIADTKASIEEMLEFFNHIQKFSEADLQEMTYVPTVRNTSSIPSIDRIEHTTPAETFSNVKQQQNNYFLTPKIISQ